MIKKIGNELFEAIADIVPKSCFVELMSGQKVRAEKSQINDPHSLSLQNHSLMAVILNLMFPALLKCLLI